MICTDATYHGNILMGQDRLTVIDFDEALIPTFIMIRRMAQVGWLHLRPEIDAGEFLETAGPEVCRQCAAFKPPF